VDTDQDGLMPACFWAQENEIEYVAKRLGPELGKNNIETKIWILDHNYNLWGRVICELEHPEVNKYVEGVAWHGYAGVASAMTHLHEAFPNKHAYWTEGGPILNPAYETDWNKWASKNAEILSNWSRCVISWNLALDEKGHPNIGPAPCAGFVTIDAQTKEITRSGQYWTFAHYARAGRRRTPLRLPNQSGKFIPRGLRESGWNQGGGDRESGNRAPDPHPGGRQNGAADAPGRFAGDA
jgi:glucosylceramidase